MHKLRIVVMALIFLLLAGCVATAVTYPFWGRTSPPTDIGGDPNPVDPGDPVDPVDPVDPGDPVDPVDPVDPNMIPRPQHVRGIYLSGNGAGAANLREPVLELLRESELNALVIDVKRDDGHVTYRDTSVQLAIDAGANINFVDMHSFIDTLREEEVYPIARIVVAKDQFVSKIKPEWFFKNKDGGVWKDKGGNAWADISQQGYWDYLVDLAIEAAEMGFREIQWDYVRFPSGGDGSMATITGLPSANMTGEGTYQRSEIIASFLAYSKERLAPYNVEISADTFGIMGTTSNEQSVGQQLEVILGSEIDVISPMIYPGHYWAGTYGQSNPNRAPYEVVYQSTLDHLERMEAMDSNTVMRPWLQDFVDHSDRNFPYGVKEIHAQLRALDELGVKEYLFWNARNVYTWEAYKTWEWSE